MGVSGRHSVCDLNPNHSQSAFDASTGQKSVPLKTRRARLLRSALATFLSVAYKRRFIYYLLRPVYHLRDPEPLEAVGSLISCPACNSTLGPMPFRRATSSTESLR